MHDEDPGIVMKLGVKYLVPSISSVVRITEMKGSRYVIEIIRKDGVKFTTTVNSKFIERISKDAIPAKGGRGEESNNN
jgi:hypothetical protein